MPELFVVSNVASEEESAFLSAAGVPLSPQDAGFAAGILPIVGAWRYVLADTSAKL